MKSGELFQVIDFEERRSKFAVRYEMHSKYRLERVTGAQDTELMFKPVEKKAVPTLEELGYSFDMGM
jgi:hypothetical protein